MPERRRVRLARLGLRAAATVGCGVFAVPFVCYLGCFFVVLNTEHPWSDGGA